MFRTILIGVDGSPYSKSALELGIRWASRFDAMLVGLGVIDEPSICKPQMVPIGGGSFKQDLDDTLLARARARVNQFLEQFALRCSEAKVACKLLEDVGLPSARILQEAQRYDLAMLGQKTYFHFATQDVPDETLTTVLKNTPRPIVMVPEKLTRGTNVVIAYDGSLQAARALQALQNSGLAATGEVCVLSVGSDHVETGRHADRAIDFLGFHKIKAERRVVDPTPSVADAILQEAWNLNAGLLVMGCYGQSTLKEFFLGSATKTILKKSLVPVFLYH